MQHERYRDLEVESEGPVAILALNRPQVINACDAATHAELQAAIAAAEADVAIGAIVLTGRGRGFCSGSDLRHTRTLKGTAISDYVELDLRTKDRIAQCRKPVIAALHGAVVGGGFELALACDIRLAAKDAFFAFPEVSLGTIPASTGLLRLAEIVGAGRARDWALTGRRIDAATALACGLVSEVLPRDRLLQEAVERARGLASNSATAMALVKGAFALSQRGGGDPFIEFQRLAARTCHDGREYAENTGKFGAGQTGGDRGPERR